MLLGILCESWIACSCELISGGPRLRCTEVVSYILSIIQDPFTLSRVWCRSHHRDTQGYFVCENLLVTDIQEVLDRVARLLYSTSLESTS